MSTFSQHNHCENNGCEDTCNNNTDMFFERAQNEFKLRPLMNSFDTSCSKIGTPSTFSQYLAHVVEAWVSKEMNLLPTLLKGYDDSNMISLINVLYKCYKI